ncbi:hypothetical protein ACERIT_08830 [Halopenitus sp. H-Gu1]|uniref:hypothetical protein n=1 Tax=Halopenitus sp. H-Gu1 TaxID=3242697 RepID=UPI00359E58FE
MAKRTARYACFEHVSLEAMIDVCPPVNSEGLFDVDEDAWAIAKLYTSHDELEGVQFRDQQTIENQEDMAIVVRDLADTFYENFSDGLDVGEREEPSPGLTIPDGWLGDTEHRTLDEF